MSLETVLIQIVCFSCVLLLLRARTLRGWVIVAVGILLVVGVTALLAPAQTAWVSGGLWSVLIVLPLLGFGQVNRLVMQERYGEARQLVTWVRWLHPMDGWMAYPQLLHGLELGQQGKVDEAIRAFREQGTTSPMARTAIMLLYRMDARWQDAVTWVQANLPGDRYCHDLSVGIIYVRSLGEIGDLNGMLQALEPLAQRLETMDAVHLLSLVRMYALAFCGQVESVQTAFDGVLSVYGVPARDFWVTTAEVAAGNRDAYQRLSALRTRADLPLQRAIDWRLAHHPPRLDHDLTDASRQMLIRLKTVISYPDRLRLSTSPDHRQTPITYSLIAVNLLLFAVQSQSGASDNPIMLVQLGAMIPQFAWQGEWWRVISANFLHINIIHLVMNLVGLFWLGRLVESTVGSGRFLAIYALSGIGAMFTVALVAILTQTPPMIAVGASGAIMGLLGAMVAMLVDDWQRHRAAIAAKQLSWLLLLIGIQTLFDSLNPEVSIIGHLAGLILGLIVGYGLIVLRRHPKGKK